MEVYHLGKIKTGPYKESDCYFVSKRTGTFLLVKHSSRAKFTYRLKLIKGSDKIKFEPEVTDVEYKNLKYSFNGLLPNTEKMMTTTIEEIVEMIGRSSLGKFITEIYEPTIRPAKEPDSFFNKGEYHYRLTNGSILTGTLSSIAELCGKLGEKMDIKKIDGFDENKFYYSSSKNEWIEISKMATPHIMNSLVKNIRDYYDILKVDKECSIPNFFDKLQKWTDDKVTVSLTEELNKRI